MFVASRLVQGGATALLGLMAGFFFAFAIDVAPAMARLDAATYISTQQAINQVVRNAGFGAVYFGSALLPWVAAALLMLQRQPRRALAWAGLALVYGGLVFWLTRTVNVPINEALAGWSPTAPPVDWALQRERWNGANRVRAVASALCFCGALGLLAWPARAGRP